MTDSISQPGGELPPLEMTELIVRYADGTASEEDLVTLNHCLISFPSACETFARIYLQISVASERAQASQAFGASSASTRSRTLSGGVAATMWGTEWLRRFRMPLAAVAAIVIGTWFTIVNMDNGAIDGRGPVELTFRDVRAVEFLQGTVSRRYADGSQEPLSSSTRFRPGDRIVTGGDGSMVTLEMGDGSTITAMENSDIVLPDEEEKQIEVRRGVVAFSPMLPQRDDPLTVRTRNSEMNILSTSFVVEQRRASTYVAVYSGKVELKSATFTRTIDVTAGRSGSIIGAGPPDVQPTVPAPDRMAESFERGLPNGALGRAVAGGLPRGSNGGVRAIFTDRNASRDVPGHYELSLSATDMSGLALLKNSSHVRITCRFERLQQVDLLLGIMSLDPVAPRHHFYRYDLLHEDVGTPQLWRQVTIPLKKFRSERRFGSGEFDGPSPRQGMTPVSVVLRSAANDTQGDPGIVVDSIEFLPDGPGEVALMTVR